MTRLPVLLLLVCAATACNGDVWALVDFAPPETDADLAPAVPDAGLDSSTDAGRDVSTDAELDVSTDASASTSPSVGAVYGTGFHDHVGLTVYGRIGSTSAEIVSSTVQPDGSFTLHFTQVDVWVGTSILYIFIDVTESGSCSDLQDYLGELIGFLEFADGFEIHITPTDLSSSIWGCFRFQLT
jgi:hypothetical protein